MEKQQKYELKNLPDRLLLEKVLSEFFPATKVKEACALIFSKINVISQLRYGEDLVLAPDVTKSLDLLCEFAKRYNKRPPLELGQVTSSKVIGEYMRSKLGKSKQEILLGVYLDTKNQILAQKKVFVGTLNETTVHPREILKLALKYSAARFIIVHNHPSGFVEPSANDIALTKRLKQCGELLGISLLDHIIVGSDAYLSMQEEKILFE